MTEVGGKGARRNRTIMSCNRCKARKTKCNNPVPGPCDYCYSIGETCQIDIAKRRQKPYYFVSEEEYRHMQKILKHHFPERDLTLPTLRSIASECDQERDPNAAPPVLASTTGTCRETTSTSAGRTTEKDFPTAHNEDDVDLQEIVDLHKGLGCMMVDGRGEYRYTGADSGISFNTAVRAWKTRSPQAFENTDIITPMSTVALPAAISKSTSDSRLTECRVLPPRHLCLNYVTRYFEEVHCLYWLYSSEQFHTRLEATYTDQEKAQEPSWLCSLYSIFALGSLTISHIDEPVAKPHAGDYLDMAKSLTPGVCDEANLDSVRALILLALAMHSHGFSNSAYIYAGTAVRIAFSLGLHVDKYSTVHGPVEKEHARRIWWVLYIFDQEIALKTGKPCMIETRTDVLWRPPLPSEHIINPGPYTPSGYLEVSIALSRLTKASRDTLYIEPLAGRKRLSLSKVETLLSALQDWSSCVPPHLSCTVPTAPLHQRGVALLHVRYWSVVMLISRPFMLHSLLACKNVGRSSSLKCFEELGNVCLDAAEHSLDILQQMVAKKLLSSIVVSDFYYALELVQLFLIALALDPSEKHLENVRSSLGILQAMESFGFCRRMLPEVLNQLKDWGVLHGESENPTSLQDFDTSLMGFDSGYNFYEMLINVNESTDLDPTDMFFADMDTFEGDLGDAVM